MRSPQHPSAVMVYPLISTYTRSLHNSYIVRTPLLTAATAAHAWRVSSQAKGVSQGWSFHDYGLGQLLSRPGRSGGGGDGGHLPRRLPQTPPTSPPPPLTPPPASHPPLPPP